MPENNFHQSPMTYILRATIMRSKKTDRFTFSDCTRRTNQTNIYVKYIQYIEKKIVKVFIYSPRLTMVALTDDL